MFSNF